MQRLVHLLALRGRSLLLAVIDLGSIAARLDRRDDFRAVAGGFVIFDRHAASQQVHLHGRDTRHGADALLDVRRAGRAAHAADPETLFHIGFSFLFPRKSGGAGKAVSLPTPSPGEG